MGEAEELLEAAQQLNITAEKLSPEMGISYISSVLNKFAPHKTSGHLAIRNDSNTLRLDKYEFSYSQYLDDEAVYVFFAQDSAGSTDVVCIHNGQRLCSVLNNSFGMEYFVSNKTMDYLLAVNWYVIEGTGTAKAWMQRIENV